jgi:O-antigen/teichoic acid export membrane protein/glycosyltransferase involved in cell wall biosynthesis
MAWSGGVSIANGVILWMMMARWRQPAEIGQFTAIIGLQAIFTTICALGIGPYLTGEIARRRDRVSFIASATVLIESWAAILTVAMTAIGFAINQSPTAHLSAVILSLTMLPSGLISVAESVFTALGRARVIALATTTENFLRTLIPLFLLYRGYSLPAICLSFVVMRLSACVAYAIVARRHLGALLSATWPLAREIAARTPTFAGVNILAAAHWQLGSVLISRLGNDQTAAEYGVTTRFFVPVTVLFASYASVILPDASRLAKDSLRSLEDFLSRCLRLVIALALPFAVGAVALGRDLLELLFGSRYAAAWPALGLLAMSVIPFGVIMVASRGLIATGRQRFDLLGNLAAVGTNVALNFILIPRFGAPGAAAAQLLSVSAMALVEIHFGARKVFSLSLWRAIWICRGPLLVMTAVIWQARKLGAVCALVFGGLSYLAGLALIWDRIRPSRRSADEKIVSDQKSRPRVLMVGAHLTKTLGGISTMISEILHSSLTREFEFRHLASQADEYGPLGKIGLAILTFIRFGAALLWWRPSVAYIHVGGNASLYRKVPFIALARLSGRRVVTHFHAGDFDFYYHDQPWLGRQIIRRGLGLSHQLIAVSDNLGQRLRDLLPSAKVAVVPNGIKTAIFKHRRKAPARQTRLLFVGAMGRLKGERDLIHALQQAPELEPSLRVTLLGNGAETIRPFAQTSSVWPLIEHLGPAPLEKRVKFFKQADLFVLPTYAEGMPVSVLEAMAAGLPVISTRVGGIPELIEDGVEGYLVAPGDVEALANRITRLIRDPSERRRMGERARAKARNFDEKLVLARLGAQLRIATDQTN